MKNLNACRIVVVLTNLLTAAGGIVMYLYLPEEIDGMLLGIAVAVAVLPLVGIAIFLPLSVKMAKAAEESKAKALGAAEMSKDEALAAAEKSKSEAVAAAREEALRSISSGLTPSDPSDTGKEKKEKRERDGGIRWGKTFDPINALEKRMPLREKSTTYHPPTKSDWICPICDTKNAHSDTVCPICGYTRT